jgi:hypothetical protein
MSPTTFLSCALPRYSEFRSSHSSG